MNTQDISYALAKQVPDMAFRGFVIGTSYGELTIDDGPLAERIAAHVRRELEAELQAQQGIPNATEADTVRLSMAGEEAVSWFDDYVASKLADDGRNAQGFRFDHRLIGEYAAHDERHPALPPCPEADAAPHAAPGSQQPCGPAQPPATPETDGGHQ